MSTVPSQYSGFQNLPENQLGGLSPLQLAATYYMVEGKQVPFFINHDWLRSLNVFCNSGILDPKTVGGNGPVVVKGDDIYTIENASDCGPDEKNRTELVYRGKASNLNISVWQNTGDTVIRGGSAANGAGGPWGTGGVSGPSPDPGNSVGQPEPLVSNIAAEYSTTTTQQSWIEQYAKDPDAFNSEAFKDGWPVSPQGLG